MLRVDGLVRAYGAVRALDGMTFGVRPGTVSGFLGPNGSGKTTTMRAIFGLTELDAGEVIWNDRRVTAADRLRFGYLPEERGLYPKMPILEQIVYFGQLRGISRADARQRGSDWLERLGLGDRADDKVEVLSLGNQQRVQLIVCLLHQPDVLVLDEPFSGLDPVAVNALSDVLVEQAQAGATVMFSSHQLDLVQDLCEDAIVVNRGRVVVDGSIEELTVGQHPVLEVDVPADPEARWVRDALDGRPDRLLSAVHGRARIEMLGDDAATQAQRYLDAARAAGDVRRFGLERRTLAEVFLSEVGESADEITEAAQQRHDDADGGSGPTTSAGPATEPLPTGAPS